MNYAIVALTCIALSFSFAWLLVYFFLREPTVVDRGVINHRDLQTGYYIAINNHGKPVPWGEKEIVWVNIDADPYVETTHEGNIVRRPLRQFTFLREWNGKEVVL